MTSRRVDALIGFVEYGMDERAYDINVATGVDIVGTKAEVNTRINAYLRDVPRDRREYSAEDLREMADGFRAAAEMLAVLGHMRGKRQQYQAAKQRKREAAS